MPALRLSIWRLIVTIKSTASADKNKIPPAPGGSEKYNSKWGKYWQVAGLHVDEDDDEDDYLKKDIFFGVRIPGAPNAQLALRNNIDRTLSALKSIYPVDRSSVQRYSENRARFNEAYFKLLSLAQLGLATKNGHAHIANAALLTLKAEIIDREAGRIKNDYMKKLGLWAVVPALIFGMFYLLYDEFIYWPDEIQRFRHIFLVWIGCLGGTWASFGARKVILSFDDLANLEKDRLDPPMRLIFTGLVTTFFVLMFTTSLVTVEIGGFSSDAIMTSGGVALLVGALFGLSEQALPAAIMERADNFMAALVATGERDEEPAPATESQSGEKPDNIDEAGELKQNEKPDDDSDKIDEPEDGTAGGDAGDKPSGEEAESEDEAKG